MRGVQSPGPGQEPRIHGALPSPAITNKSSSTPPDPSAKSVSDKVKAFEAFQKQGGESESAKPLLSRKVTPPQGKAVQGGLPPEVEALSEPQVKVLPKPQVVPEKQKDKDRRLELEEQFETVARGVEVPSDIAGSIVRSEEQILKNLETLRNSKHLKLETINDYKYVINCIKIMKEMNFQNGVRGKAEYQFILNAFEMALNNKMSQKDIMIKNAELALNKNPLSPPVELLEIQKHLDRVSKEYLPCIDIAFNQLQRLYDSLVQLGDAQSFSRCIKKMKDFPLLEFLSEKQLVRYHSILSDLESMRLVKQGVDMRGFKYPIPPPRLREF